MPQFQPRDPNYADRVAVAFRNESAASPWGGELSLVSPGEIEITLPAGYGLHSSVAALLDDACVLAAMSLSSAGDAVATAEYKVNFLASASSQAVVAHAEVVRPGRSITVCRADAYADGLLVAKMLATLAVSRPVVC